MPVATHKTQIQEKAGVATYIPLVGIRNHEYSTRGVDHSTSAISQNVYFSFLVTKNVEGI